MVFQFYYGASGAGAATKKFGDCKQLLVAGKWRGKPKNELSMLVAWGVSASRAIEPLSSFRSRMLRGSQSFGAIRAAGDAAVVANMDGIQSFDRNSQSHCLDDRP